MAVTVEVVMESPRVAMLRTPEADSCERTALRAELPEPGPTAKSYTLPPSEFHEIGPILRALGARVTERRPSLLERIRDKFRPPSGNTTRLIVLASR